MRKFLFLAILAGLLCAAPISAKEGLYADAFLSVVNIEGSSSDSFDQAYFDSLDPGLGAGVRIGAGFNENVAVEASFFKSSHETDFLGFSNLENQEFTGKILSLKLSMPVEQSNLQPYLFLGVGQYEIGDSSGVYYKGRGGEFGLGTDYYLEPEVSIHGGLTYRTITFDKGKFHLDTDADASAISLDFGIAFHFL
jgi:hypothetical protein